jgi:hypothetical protein
MTERRLSLRAALIAACFLAIAPLDGRADAVGASAPGTERIFATTHMEGVEAGQGVLYSRARTVPEGGRAQPIGEGEVRLAREAGAAGDVVSVSLVEDGRTRRLDPFPAASGNPILVVFLESSLRAMAQATGGSPFYLRNRIKEALWKGTEPEPVTVEWEGADVAAERMVYRPFEGDRHSAQLGQFSEVEIEFVLSDAVPGRFVRLAAATAPGEDAAFREEIRLIGETK